MPGTTGERQPRPSCLKETLLCETEDIESVFVLRVSDHGDDIDETEIYEPAVTYLYRMQLKVLYATPSSSLSLAG